MPHPNTAQMDSFSRCALYLRMFYGNELLSTGTGLLARAASSVHLFTALHNFTGREPNGACKSPTGGIPNRVEITGYYFRANVPLYGGENDPTRDPPRFVADGCGPEIDVCALRITSGFSNASPLDASFLDPAGHSQTVRLAVAQMCFVVGYPEGLFVRESENAVFPIWKTGHIAVEPSVYVDGVPKFLIDAATRPGMSGSPVFLRERSMHRLLGLYTGRTSETSELGYVFSPEVLIGLVHR